MFDAASHPYLVPADNSFRYDQASTKPPKSGPSKKLCEKRLQRFIKNLDEGQRRLYAHAYEQMEHNMALLRPGMTRLNERIRDSIYFERRKAT